MNKVYRLIRNRHSGVVQVAPEIARAHGKGKDMVKAGALAAVLACTSPMAWAAETYWNAGTSDWFTSTNWSTNAVPTDFDFDFAYINNGGTAQVQSAGAVAEYLGIGYSGTGNLEISNSGTLSISTSSSLGYQAGSSGTVIVDGAESTWSNSYGVSVGYGGTGTLTIRNGGSASSNLNFLFGELPSGTGTATVTGSGSSLTAGSSIYVGHGGTGTLTLSSGGEVSNTNGFLGNSAGSSGTVTVDGIGSSWSNSGNLTVGNAGTGTLTLSSGGVVSNTDGVLGNSAGSSGTVTVDGIGSSWSNSGTLTVGKAGTGALTVSSGGAVSNTDSYLGTSASGTVTVNGAGSTWTNTGYLYLGYLNTGALNISNGGVVNSNESWLAVAAGTSGTATVDGTDSTWTNSNNLLVGDNGTGALTITNGGAVSNTNGSIGSASGNGTVTVDGAGSTWSNSGSLTVGNRGTGTLTISNGGAVSNTDGSLGSNIGSGTVTVDGAGSSWSNSGNLTVGNYGTGTLTVSNGATVNVAAGTGTVTLAKLTPFSGSSSGTLNIGDGGVAGILNAASVTGGTGTATLNFNHTDGNYYFTSDGTAGGTAINITGSTAVNQIGSGTTILTGANTYSGGTTVTAGTLRSGSAGAFVSNTAYTINGGTLDLNGNSLTMSTLSGSGGSITLGSAALTVNQGTDTTYAGVISGSGSLIKSGSGTLYLTGNNTYNGTTTVAAGTLRINGSNASSATTVNNGGTLGGSGTVGSVTVNSGGTLAPGNSIGTLNVAGDVDFSGGGVYQVEVDAAGNSDKIIATGTATLTSGSVQVLPEAGSYNYSTDYTILTAGSLIGTFDSVSSNLAFLDPTLSYDSNNVTLTLTRNDVSFGDVSDTKNQRAVGNALSIIASSGTSGDMQRVLSSITPLTASGARQAYESLSGVQHADTQSLLIGANNRFSNLLHFRSNALAANPGMAVNQQAGFTPIRLAYNGDLSDLQLASNGSTTGLMESDGSGFWLTPQGGVGSIEDTANASGLNYTWYGLYGGADTWLDNQRLVGIALGASRSDADPAAGKTTIDSLELAAYGRWQNDTRYLDASLNVGKHSTDTARRVVVGSLNRTASADYDAQSLGLSLEAGQTAFEHNDQRVTPFVGLRYARLSRDGFTETGAGSANLVVDSDTQQSLQGRLGIRTSQHSESSSGRRLDWDVSVAWAREFMDNTGTLKAGFEGAPSTTFSVDGPALDRNRVQLAVGLTTDIGQRTSLRIGYDGELAGSDQSHAASANLRVAW